MLGMTTILTFQHSSGDVNSKQNKTAASRKGREWLASLPLYSGPVPVPGPAQAA
jgi:hypothetical protein